MENNDINNNIEVDLDFTDITMVETEGVFEEANKKMFSELTLNDKWVIKTNLIISSKFGTGEMVLDFYYDKKVFVIGYVPSMKDVFYNSDIQALSKWCQENGWKIPQPHPDLIKVDREFWKHFYDTLIIDCDYFDKLYGKRPQLEEEENE